MAAPQMFKDFAKGQIFTKSGHTGRIEWQNMLLTVRRSRNGAAFKSCQIYDFFLIQILANVQMMPRFLDFLFLFVLDFLHHKVRRSTDTSTTDSLSAQMTINDS